MKDKYNYIKEFMKDLTEVYRKELEILIYNLHNDRMLITKAIKNIQKVLEAGMLKDVVHLEEVSTILLGINCHLTISLEHVLQDKELFLKILNPQGKAKEVISNWHEEMKLSIKTSHEVLKEAGKATKESEAKDKEINA
jgi:hypothetical protein